MFVTNRKSFQKKLQFRVQNLVSVLKNRLALFNYNVLKLHEINVWTTSVPFETLGSARITTLHGYRTDVGKI